MPFRRVGDIVTHYQRAGGSAAPTLVLANSLGTDLRVWDALMPQLAAHFDVVRYDKRGHGLTDATPGPYSVAMLADDLARLLDALEVHAAVVCGLSIGGLIAQTLAASRPDLVRGLVLMDTAHKVGTAELWEQRMAAIRAGGIAGIADEILERWLTREFRAQRPEELAGWRNMLTRTPVEGYLGCCAAIRDADLTREASRLQLPVLCMVGEEDGATPPALVAELAGLIPRARLVRVPGAGHLPCVERPKLVGPAILRFAEESSLVR
jgi:3-oxoadipate enol-lactonase